MDKEVENAQTAFESLEKAILNEVKASQLEDITARQKLRRIANTLAIKGFVVQLAPSKGAVFSYPPDSSLFAIVNGNVLVKEESQFLKVFRAENYIKIGEESVLIHMTMIRSILPVQMIFLRSRTVFFLMLFIVLMTIGVFIYLKLNEGEKAERVYTDFACPSQMKQNSPAFKNVHQKYSFNDDLTDSYRDEHYGNALNEVHSDEGKTGQFNQMNANSHNSKSSSFSATFTHEPAYSRFQNSSLNPSTTNPEFSLNSASYLSSAPSSLEPLAFEPVTASLNNPSSVEDEPYMLDNERLENIGLTDAQGYQAEHQFNSNQTEPSAWKRNENTSHPLGLYSPKTGLVWKVYVPERLESELGKAAEIDQDLSFIIIKILDVDYDSLDLKRLSEIMIEIFKFKDMVFEYSDDETLGFAAILQDVYVDEAVKVCEKLFSKLQHEIFLTGQEPTIKMGITTRACRLISASVIITEAEKALYNAMQNEAESIVGYRPSAEKYRQHSIENDR